MAKDWTGSVEIVAIAVSIGCLLTALFSQAVIPAVLGVLPLVVAVGLNSRSRRRIEASRMQAQLRIDRLEQICADQTAYVNRLAGAAPSAPGQEAILMRMRRAMAESYAKTQNRLIALEMGELNTLRQDVSHLRSNYQALQQKLDALPQIFDRVKQVEQDLHQLQAHLSQFSGQCAPATIGREVQGLKTQLDQPMNRPIDQHSKKTSEAAIAELNSRLIHLEAAIQDLNCRFTR